MSFKGLTTRFIGACTCLFLFMPAMAQETRVPTANEGAELDEFSRQSGTSIPDLIKRWQTCTVEQPENPVDCTKSISTPVWVPGIYRDPITDEIVAAVSHETDFATSITLLCSGRDASEVVISISTTFILPIEEFSVVARVGQGEPKSEDQWERSGDGMGVELRGAGAKEIVSGLLSADRFAYRIESSTGNDVQVIDLLKFPHEARSVIAACSW